MAYAVVAQGEHEALCEDLTSVNMPSPTLPEISHRPLSLAFDQVSGEIAVIDPTAPDENDGSRGVGAMLKSLSSSHSYRMVEADDYEEPLPSKRPSDPTTMSEQPPIRTASISRNLPLNHPTPDLQSLQGAYIRNVERLEESAERLSMTSSLEEELHKMKRDQRRLERNPSASSSQNGAGAQRQVSLPSVSNSIIGVNNTARSGGYSPAGYIVSPHGSIHSASRSHQPQFVQHTTRGSHFDRQFPEPELEARPLESDVDNRDSRSHPVGGEHLRPSASSENEPASDDRPPTSASNDTYRQGNNLFNDFDGVHYNTRASLERGASSSRRISLGRPPLARDSKAYKEPQPGQNMIYYPAPVPVMLNLPTRLSKVNFSSLEKRRLQGLSGINEDMKKSAPWLANESTSNLAENRASMNLPPQLRASAFFEQKSNAPDIVLKDGSAVATLDSILDASAHAPVSAFTDHPIAGHLGKEVYGPERPTRKSVQLQNDTKQKQRSSLSTLLKTKSSSNKLDATRNGRATSRDSKLMDAEDGTSGDELERAAGQSIAPDHDELVDGDHDTSGGDEEDEGDNQSSELEHQPGFSGAPTTLLAELHLRKAAQKQRNRTAADAFPNGMHSTLLELDAVTQLQQKSRKQKHVTLAWEDHDAADRENFDDEDIPLGLLFPEKNRANHMNLNRPIGLLEKREIEDNEPLSHRRARLRGEPIQPPRSESFVRPAQAEDVDDSNNKVDLLGTTQAVLDEHEGETLVQRIKRMKEEKQQATGSDFAAEISSQLGLNIEEKEADASKTPDPEETLGQRRKRLKEEALRNGRKVSDDSEDQVAPPQLKPRRSMADILQAHPAGALRQTSNEANYQLPRASTYGPTASFTSLPATRSYMPQIPAHMSGLPYYNHSPYMSPGYSASQGAMFGGGYSGPSPFGTSGHQYGYGPGMIQDPMSGPPLDPKQRAVIDRWREGVV